MLWDRCLSCLSVCNVGALWPNGWMDQDTTWYGGRPRSRPNCVRWGPSSPRGTATPLFDTCLLWPNGWIDQDATWCRGGPRPTRHCIRWGPSSNNGKGHTHTHTPNGKGHSSPHFLAHVYLIVVKRSPISATAELLLLFVFHA